MIAGELGWEGSWEELERQERVEEGGVRLIEGRGKRREDAERDEE